METTMQSAPVGGAPVAPKKRTWLKVLIIIILLMVAIIGGAFWMTAGASGVATEFMESVVAHDGERAYALISTSLKADGGTLESFEAYLSSDSIFSKVTSYEITGRSIENSTGRVEGTLTTSDGNTYPFSIVLAKVDGKWQVTGWDEDTTGE